MIRKKHWHVRDKWKRHLALIGHRGLSRHIPRTSLLGSKVRLKRFLDRYRVVFVKPVYGSFGNRIMKITQNRNTYLVQRENRVRRLKPNQVTKAVYRHTGSGRFLLQRGIAMLKVKGHPADFRVLMLRPGNQWQYMGIMGKVATGNRIVTNYNHGGRAIRFRESLRRAGWSQANINHMERRMRQIGMTAAYKFNRRFKNCRRLGIDIAIDQNKKLWILEVNTNPFFNLFRHHENRKLYGKIRRYMNRIKKNQSSR